MKTSDSIAKITPAYLKAQTQIDGASKGSYSGGFKNFYADISAVIDAIKFALNENGIAILQPVGRDELGDYVETILLHESGEMFSEKMRLVLGKADPQGMGSAITYARRYSLSAFVLLKTYDDDGNAACGANPAPAKPQPQKAAASQPHNAGTQSGPGFAELSEGMDDSWAGLLQDAKIINSKPDAVKKWSMVAAKLSDGREACTFDKALMAAAQGLIGASVVLSVKPGRVEGKFELTGIIPAQPPKSAPLRAQDGGLRNDEISEADMTNNTF